MNEQSSAPPVDPARPADWTQETVHCDTAREAELLGAGSRAFLEEVESRLDVSLTARDNWIQISGVGPAVHRAQRFFESLRQARARGSVPKGRQLQYALNAFAEGRAEDWERLSRARVEVAPSQPPVFARTFGQRAYLEAIARYDICFGLGPAGTGKTYLAMAMAVSSLLRHEVSRIILTRPAIEAGEALGFLPGDLQEKVSPYLRPLYDALYDMMAAPDIQRHLDRGQIEIAPLAYMRGRTLNHAFIILDEAQNTTTEQMLMFLTRMGFDSKCVITGDMTQVDLPPSKTSGLHEARHVLANIERIAFVELTDDDVVRHSLVQTVIQAYRAHRAVRPAGAARS